MTGLGLCWNPFTNWAGTRMALCPWAGHSCFSECKYLQMGYPEFSVAELMRIQDLGVQNVPRDRYSSSSGGWAEHKSVTVWASAELSVPDKEKSEFCSSAVPHPCLGWFLLWGQMRLCHERSRRALPPFLQQCKCDRIAMLLDQLGASLEKWIINLCFWVNNV